MYRDNQTQFLRSLKHFNTASQTWRDWESPISLLRKLSEWLFISKKPQNFCWRWEDFWAYCTDEIGPVLPGITMKIFKKCKSIFGILKLSLPFKNLLESLFENIRFLSSMLDAIFGWNWNRCPGFFNVFNLFPLFWCHLP